MDALLASSGVALCIGSFVILALLGVVVSLYLIFAPQKTATGERLKEFGASPAARQNRKRDEAVDKIAQRLASLANPNDEDDRNKLRLGLVQAGFTSRSALEVYNITRALLAILLPVPAAVLAGLVLKQPSFTQLVGIVILACAFGYFVPKVIVDGRRTERQKKLLRPFPDALDLLVSSVEAGLGLDAAFRRVAEEIETTSPELAREFQLVNAEISAGVARTTALRHLAGRTGLDEINSLVNMLTQAERYGTSIARSLRIHSSVTRQKRMARAEEEAAKVSPKLTVVMILTLIPCLMVVLLGPAAISIYDKLLAQ